MEPGSKRTPNNRTTENQGSSFEHSAAQALASLLGGSSVAASAGAALERLTPGPYVLVALRPDSRHNPIDTWDVEDLLHGSSIRFSIVNHDGLIIAFISSEQSRRFVSIILDKPKNIKRSVVVSLPFESAADIPRQYSLLKYCLDKNPAEGVYNAKNFALDFLSEEITKQVSTASLLHPALAKLAQYDEANQSNLLDTLKVYLDNDRNAQRCANMLYLHRNSLQYRVRRIQEIAGIDLENVDERAYLRLSFLLYSK